MGSKEFSNSACGQYSNIRLSVNPYLEVLMVCYYMFILDISAPGMSLKIKDLLRV